MMRFCFPLLILVLYSCKEKEYKTPPGYDLLHPEKIVLNKSLKEISGIYLLPGNDSLVYAIEDERGRLYSVTFPGNETTEIKFAKKSDYEDLVFWKNRFYILDSKGSVISVSFNFSNNEVENVKDYANIIPPANYEGLGVYHDTLYVLCKRCKEADAQKNLLIYKLLVGDSTITTIGSIQPAFEGHIKNKNGKFTPSALAKNPYDNNWYVISAENFSLMIFNEHFEFIDSYRLKPDLYPQPEGMTFTDKGDLFISSEGVNGAGSLMLIRHKAD